MIVVKLASTVKVTLVLSHAGCVGLDVKSLIVTISPVVTAVVFACPPLAIVGTPSASTVVPRLLELPPLLPPANVAVATSLSPASVASGQPSLSLSVSKPLGMPSLSVSIRHSLLDNDTLSI